MDEKEKMTEKPKQTKPSEKKSKPGLMQRLRGFLADLRGEGRKIIWPSRKELQKKTITVIVTSLIFAAVIFCIDSIYNLGLQLFVSLLG